MMSLNGHEYLSHGCTGLLEARLNWGGPLSIEQECWNRIPQLPAYMLADGLERETSGWKDGTGCRVGLSTTGSCLDAFFFVLLPLRWCLSWGCGAFTLRQCQTWGGSFDEGQDFLLMLKWKWDSAVVAIGAQRKRIRELFVQWVADAGRVEGGFMQ